MKGTELITKTINKCLDDLVVLRDNFSDDGFDEYAEDIEDICVRLNSLKIVVQNASTVE